MKYPGEEVNGMPRMFAPSRGRELKCKNDNAEGNRKVRPLAGAGIEIHALLKAPTFPAFAPSRGRELK